MGRGTSEDDRAKQMLESMRHDLAEMEMFREEIGEVDEGPEGEPASGSAAVAQGSCCDGLMEILDMEVMELDDEDQENLKGLAEVALQDPQKRRNLPLAMVLRRLPSALLPPEDPAGGPPAFKLEEAEVAKLLADKDEMPFWLCERLLASSQGRGVNVKEVVPSIVARPELLEAMLTTKRLSAGKGSLDAHHIEEIAKSSPQARKAVLDQASCRAMLPEPVLLRLRALQQQD